MFWVILLICLGVWLYLRHKKKQQKAVEEAQAEAERQARIARQREAKVREAAAFALWEQKIKHWCAKLDATPPTAKEIENVLSVGGYKMSFNGKYGSYDEEKVQSELLDKMDKWLDVATEEFLSNVESQFSSCSNLQDVGDVLSDSQSALQKMGNSQYYSDYRFSAITSMTADIANDAMAAAKEKLVPITVNDVLAFNKVCYLYGEGDYWDGDDDNRSETHCKWFVCENEVLIYREGKSQSLSLMRIVGIQQGDPNALNLEVLVRTNSFTVTIAGNNVRMAELAIKALQAKQMNISKS